MEVIEIDAITGEVTERKFTVGEIDQRKADKTAADQTAADQAAADKARLRSLAAARAFALSLGFTEAMLDVMFTQPAEAPSE